VIAAVRQFGADFIENNVHVCLCAIVEFIHAAFLKCCKKLSRWVRAVQ
jgi:hypothetical protein